MTTYRGYLIRINLSDRKITTESIPVDIQKHYLGACGFGANYLYDELALRTDPDLVSNT